MKINGVKFSQLDKIFIGVFFESVPSLIEKWQSYILSNNLTLSFDHFLLDLTKENTPKKNRMMFKQFKKRVPRILELWQVQQPTITFDEWCMYKYNKHKEIVQRKK